MTIQEAINKAIEGGYPKKRVADLSLHVQAQYFLESTFWEALIGAFGVEGNFEVREELRTVALPSCTDSGLRQRSFSPRPEAP
jgi:hypothetical protein